MQKLALVVQIEESCLNRYCERFVPKSLCPDLPLVLTSLYDPENLKLDYHDLLQASSDVMSPEQVLIVEQQT